MNYGFDLIKDCLNIENTKDLDIKYDIKKNEISYLIKGNKVVISYNIGESTLATHNLGTIRIKFVDKEIKKFKVTINYYPSDFNNNKIFNSNKIIDTEYSCIGVDYDPVTTHEVDFIRALNIGLIKASCITIFVEHFKNLLPYKLDKELLSLIKDMNTGDIFEYLYFLNKEKIYTSSDFEIYWNLQSLQEDISKESILKDSYNFINHIKQYKKRELYGNIKH